MKKNLTFKNFFHCKEENRIFFTAVKKKMPLHLNSGLKGCEEKKTNNEEIHHCYLGTTRKI